MNPIRVLVYASATLTVIEPKNMKKGKNVLLIWDVFTIGENLSIGS